jgi:RND family efflux transporter MFP subunit
MQGTRSYLKHLSPLVCVLMAGLSTSCETPTKPAEAPAIPVAVAEVQQYSGNAGVTYSASIVPYTQLPLSFKSAGYVTSILQRPGPNGAMRNLQLGDWVKKDTVLATVRQEDYQRAVDQNKGHLQQAQASQDKSQEDWDRAQALYKANALTQSDYDSAKAQYESAQGAVTTAQAALGQAQQALSDCELRAPLDGQILSRNIELGVLVAAGTTGFTMGDTQVVKAIFGVPDTLLGTVQLGKKQAIATETYPEEFVGQITAISPQADQKSRTFQVEVTLPNSKGMLKSGMVATLDLGQSKLRTPLLVVPLESIVSPADGSKMFSVFIVRREGEKDIARRVAVQPGPAYGNLVSVAGQVKVGDRVVSNGATLLNDGQLVRMIP